MKETKEEPDEESEPHCLNIFMGVHYSGMTKSLALVTELNPQPLSPPRGREVG